MSPPPPVYGRFGIALAFAERTLTDALHDHLAERGVKPETWYALHLIAMRGPVVDRETISRDLEASQNVDEPAPELLARLEREGLIEGEGDLELTEKGRTLHRSLREYIAGPTTELLGQFELDDIETTVRTLEAITERAR